MNFLSVKNLYIEYNNKFYLEDINFTLAKGETKIIIGESGGGKSLFAKSIINFLPRGFFVKSGKIFFNNTDIFSSDEDNLRIIRGGKIYYITQDPYDAFDPTYKIGKQFKEFLSQKKIVYKKDSVFKILDELGFDNPQRVVKLYPFQLSGGMLQRVSIARGLLANSKLLIADEPTTGLDYELQIDLIKLIKKIVTKRGLSLLFITHNMKIVKEFQKAKTIVLYRGEIIEENDNILKNPLHPYTKMLIESDPSAREKGKTIGFIENGDVKHTFSGCKFYDQCPYKKDVCKTRPHLTQKDNAYVRCYL